MDSPSTSLSFATRLSRRARRFVRNPILVKELRGRMRGSRAFIVLTVYLGLLSLALILVYLLFLTSMNVSGGAQRQEFGKMLFGVVFWLELLTVCFITPALTADAISGEKERQTYDILRVTLLPARDLVLGKFTAGLVYVLLLLVAALPLLALPFLFGGITSSEVIIGALLLFVTATSFCAVGIYTSSRLRSTLLATVLAYAFALLQVFGVPVLLLLLVGIFNSVMNTSFGSPSLMGELILLLGGWFLIATNPLATALVSEIILLEERQVWVYNFELTNVNVLLPLPWIPYLTIYLGVTVLFLWLSVRAVRQDKR